MKDIPVFYCPEMVANAESFSPSAGKPELAVKEWIKVGAPIEMRVPQKASMDELFLAHEEAYVREVLAGTAPNGFGNTKAAVAASLPWTSGAMLSAAREALRNKQVACAPVSGFHHAGYAYGGGFCTFNGLMVTACALIDNDEVRRILILDCDMHYGDGTDDIIEELNLFDRVDHLTMGAYYGSSQDADEYLTRLREQAERFDEYDLIIYQAGADVHVNDPLGGVLNTKQMIDRDRIVFESAKNANVPVAWDLAGGYQEPVEKVVRLHVNTMAVCADVYVTNTLKKTA